jgi:putative tryptophan/tyrosine transport system substrate-binding protein
VRRRDFIKVIAGSAAAWPLAARAQQPAMPVVGFMVADVQTRSQQIAAFHTGLKETGYVQGQNVTVELRSAEGHFNRYPALASDLLRHGVAVVVALNNDAALAAKRATTTTPIIFEMGGDPVALGLVGSLNHPGGNITGIYFFSQGLEGKRLGLLHELVPTAARIAVLVNPNYSPAKKSQLQDVQEAAARLGVQVLVLRANVEADFDAAFADLVRQRAGALLVCSSPFFFNRRQQIVVLAARHAVPAIYEWREFTAAGGLMSYGTNLNDAYRQIGVYVGRILKGEKPGDLPILQSTKFEFVLNLSTARALGIEVLPNLAARADEIIE